MKLPEVVQAAALSKLASEMKPVTDKIGRLRATLDAYEARIKEDTERRVSNSLLAALGQPETTENPAFDVTKLELHEALTQMFALVGIGEKIPIQERTEPEPKSAPALTTQPPEKESLATALAKSPAFAEMLERGKKGPPPRQLKQEDIEAAKLLIAEIEELRQHIKQQHSTRLHPLLQALTAEIRILLDRLPEDNYLHERLSQCIPTIGAFKAEGSVKEFIKGLAHGSQGDWTRLSFKNRQRVEAFDRDVEKTEVHPEAPPSKPSNGKRAEPVHNGAIVSGHQWPELARLRGLKHPILLAGGILIQEKITNVKERFGFDVEWHEIDHDNPRASQTLVQRVRAGKVGALILLEGVMRHSTYKPVVEACTNSHVPYAMGDKAGIASLQQAFDDLERKLKVMQKGATS